MRNALRLFAFAGLACLVGCAHTGTPEQQEAARIRRGKNIAKLERVAWRTVSSVVSSCLVNTAANLTGAQDRAQDRRGGRSQ